MRLIQSKGQMPLIQTVNPQPTLAWGSGIPSNRSGYTGVLFPLATITPDGQPAVMFRGLDNGGVGRVVYTKHSSLPYVSYPRLLFPYDQLAYGLATWQGNLVAVCAGASLGTAVTTLRYRESSDLGVTWTAEADLGFGLNQIWSYGPVAGQSPGIWLTTDRAGTTLYLFYIGVTGINSLQVWYKTCTVDPPTTWSAGVYSGLTIGVPGYNQGNDTAEGTHMRTFVVQESETAGTWLLHCQDGLGVFGDTKAVYSGTLGGAWTKILDQNETGGAFGAAGATGGVFLGKNNSYVTYVMDDQVTHVNFWRRDPQTGWGAGFNEVPGAPALGFGAGQGLYVPAYDQDVVWGHARVDGTLRILAVDGIVQVAILF